MSQATSPAAETTNTKPAAAAAKKEPKNMATAIDSKLSFNELQKKLEEAKKLQEELSVLIAAKRGEEIKVLADGYAKKAAAAGFSPQEAIDALLPYLPAKVARGKKTNPSKPGAAAKVHKDLDDNGERPQPGATYIMEDGSEWTYSGKGRTPDKALAAVKGKTWASIQKPGTAKK